LDDYFWRIQHRPEFYLLPVLKRFLAHISFFILPIVALLLLIWGNDVSERQKWNRLTGNCYKSACNYSLIYDADSNIDIAFIGSSRMFCSVNDTVLSKSWNKNVVNLGYCRPGRNLQYKLLQMLFDDHKPSRIFIEINQDEDWYGHFDFGNVATTKEVIGSLSDKNPKFLRDLKNNFVMKFDLTQRKWFNRPYENNYCSTGSTYREDTTLNLTPQAFADTNTKEQRYVSELYFERMVSLCNAEGCEVTFIYLPRFGLLDQEPHYVDYYHSFGEIIYPPADLDRAGFWADASHFNKQASIRFTDYLGRNFNPR
jgi:hypothetical protein